MMSPSLARLHRRGTLHNNELKWKFTILALHIKFGLDYEIFNRSIHNLLKDENFETGFTSKTLKALLPAKIFPAPLSRQQCDPAAVRDRIVLGEAEAQPLQHVGFRLGYYNLLWVTLKFSWRKMRIGFLRYQKKTTHNSLVWRAEDNIWNLKFSARSWALNGGKARCQSCQNESTENSLLKFPTRWPVSEFFPTSIYFRAILPAG